MCRSGGAQPEFSSSSSTCDILTYFLPSLSSDLVLLHVIRWETIAGEIRGNTADSLGGLLQEAIDLLICDIGPSDGAGDDLMRRPPRPSLKGVALSGYGMDEDIRRNKEAGFAAHLTKPVDAGRLEETLRTLCSREANSEA